MATEVYENEREIRGNLTVTNDISCENMYANNLLSVRKLTLTVDNVSAFDLGAAGDAGLKNGKYFVDTYAYDFTNMFDGSIYTYTQIAEIEQTSNFIHLFTNLGDVYEGFWVCYYRWYHPAADGPYNGPVIMETYSLNLCAGRISQPFFTLAKLGHKGDYITSNDYWMSGSFCVPFYGDHVGMLFNNSNNTDAAMQISRWDVYVFE